MSDEYAQCRGCGMRLNGKPYHKGGNAYHPTTGEECKKNFYGGFVCSYQCDFNSSLDLEKSMPGHDSRQRRLGCFAQQRLDSNWSQS